jgi:predicted metal-binding membrane protein
MSHVEVLSAVGLIRTSRRRGFCPACRLWLTGAEDEPGRVEGEVSPAGLTALAFLVLAALGWALTIWQSRAADAMAMDETSMGLGSPGAFAIGWTSITAATMLPSALPLVYAFARRSERRLRWRVATAVLVVTYLTIWLAFGLACYVVLTLFPVSPADRGLVGGLALALAGLYALTPMKSASEARCRELCSMHGPLPFNLIRSAMLVGGRYALSCVGCSGGLMAAMAVIGMAHLGWMGILAALVLLYKLGPAPGPRRAWLLSGVLVVLGVVYAAMA